MSKPSLFTRSQRPGAPEIHTLVQRAQEAADVVCYDYSDYVFEKLEEVKDLAAAGQDAVRLTENHRTLLQTIRDLQSSAAMAGHDWIAKYSRQLAIALAAREAYDPTLPLIVNLHLDAIKIAAQGKSSPEELRLLETELGRATESLA